MNKKEIAQQFTKQMLEQNPETLPPDQVISILTEIKNLLLNSEMRTKHLIGEIGIQEVTLANLREKGIEINRNLDLLNKEISATAGLFRRSQKVSIWQRYWMAILMGIIGALITNLIWALRMS